MHIDMHFDGFDLCAPGPIWLGTAVGREGAVGSSRRIGLTREVDRQFRFFELGNTCQRAEVPPERVNLAGP